MAPTCYLYTSKLHISPFKMKSIRRPLIGPAPCVTSPGAQEHNDGQAWLMGEMSG